MKKVFQKSIDINDNPDCMAACIASIFEKDLEDVPNFYTYGPSALRKVGKKYLWDGWVDRLQKYCVGLGKIPYFHNPYLYKKDEYGMIGVSGSFEGRVFTHALVTFGKEIVHCPSGKWNEDTHPFPIEISDFCKSGIMNHIWSVSFMDVLSLRKEIWLRK